LVTTLISFFMGWHWFAFIFEACFMFFFQAMVTVLALVC
jgi:hypothetical protein